MAAPAPAVGAGRLSPGAFLAEARAPGGLTLGLASLGFAGHVRPGAWTALWAEVGAGASDLDGRLVLEAATPTGQARVRFAVPVRGGRGATLRVFLPVILYDLRSPGTLAIEVQGEIRVSLALPRVRPADELVVVLSGEPLTIETGGPASRLAVVHVDPAALPGAWQAYEAVRLVAMRTFDDREVDETQRLALRDWLWGGGRVVVMPREDDTRHLRGATLRALRSAGAGRGHLTILPRDPVAAQAPAAVWAPLLAQATVAPPAQLDATLPPGRPVPLRAHLLVGSLIVLYLLAARGIARLAAALRPLRVAAAAAALALATAGAAALALAIRGEASGVVSASVLEGLPGTGHGLLTMAGRAVVSHPAPFAVSAPAPMLLRPAAPGDVVLELDEGATLRAGRGLVFTGTAVVPLGVDGAFSDPRTLRVSNRTGRRLEPAWLFVDGRVHPLPAIGGTTTLALDDQRWLPFERLSRTDEGHALLVWAFSRLQTDAILRTTPAWLVGWWRDPSLALAWDSRREAALQLVLVPLAGRPR